MSDMHFETDEFVKKLIDQIDVGIVVVDSSGKFLLWNQAATDLIGIGPKAVNVADWSSTYGCYSADMQTLINSEDLPLAKAMKGMITKNVELYIKNTDKPDGIWIVVSSNPILIDGLNGAVVVFKDISALKLRETEIRKVVDSLKELKNQGLQLLQRL